MKKLLKYLMIALMIFSLCACNKKPAEGEEPEETGIPFTLSADYGNGVSEDFNVSASKEGNLLETVQGLGIMNLLKIETKDGKIVKINDTEANDKSHWDVYVNDQLYDGKIEELTFKQDDVIRMVYVTSAEQPVAEKPAENGTTPESPAQTLVGGWQTYENFKENVSADEKKLFELAAAESKNVTYIPLNVLATQMVSGTNYAFLAQGIDTKPSIDYYIIIVYSDLNGYQEIKAINKLTVPDLELQAEHSDSLLGGWMIMAPDKNNKFIEKEVQTSFDTAIASDKDVTYTPIKLLATQVVNGTNYMALCYGQTKGDKPVAGLYAVVWNVDSSKKVSLISVDPLNLAYYVAGE